MTKQGMTSPKEKARSESDESPTDRRTVPPEMKGGGPRSTSLQAFHDDVATGKMENRAKVLLRAILVAPVPLTGRELVAWMDDNRPSEERLDYHAVASIQNHLRRMGLIRYGKVRACAISKRNAHPYEATEDAPAWLDGILTPSLAPSRSDRKARALRAARAVYTASKPLGRDNLVTVPMPLMVDLAVALQRLDDKEEHTDG